MSPNFSWHVVLHCCSDLGRMMRAVARVTISGQTACQERQGHTAIGQGTGMSTSTEEVHTVFTTLTLHHDFSHRLAAIGFNFVVATVFFCGLIDDQNVFAAVFLEAILKGLVSRQFHAVFLPAQKFTQ